MNPLEANASSIDIDIDMNKVDIDTNELKLILVLDTNIFMKNLNDLEVMANKYKESVLFSIPWVVLQELDGLKSRDKHHYKNTSPPSTSISFRAQHAIKFIHSILNSKTHNFIFESSLQVAELKNKRKINHISGCKLIEISIKNFNLFTTITVSKFNI